MVNSNDPTHLCCGMPLLPNDWVAVCTICRIQGCVRCMGILDTEVQHHKCMEEEMTNRSCSKCGGSGVLEDRNNEQCGRCEGTGKEPSPPMNE